VVVTLPGVELQRPADAQAGERGAGADRPAERDAGAAVDRQAWAPLTLPARLRVLPVRTALPLSWSASL
jgi:hypothetical protein